MPYMRLSELLGYLGSLCSIGSFIPQLFKTLKTRSAKDLSIWMLVIFLAGNLFWFWYGILLAAPAIIITNGSLGVMVLIILLVKLRYS